MNRPRVKYGPIAASQRPRSCSFAGLLFATAVWGLSRTPSSCMSTPDPSTYPARTSPRLLLPPRLRRSNVKRLRACWSPLHARRLVSLRSRVSVKTSSAGGNSWHPRRTFSRAIRGGPSTVAEDRCPEPETGGT